MSLWTFKCTYSQVSQIYACIIQDMDVLCSPSIEYIPIPKETSPMVRKDLIGKIDYSPESKGFITVESERNPSEEVFTMLI